MTELTIHVNLGDKSLEASGVAEAVLEALKAFLCQNEEPEWYRKPVTNLAGTGGQG